MALPSGWALSNHVGRELADLCRPGDVIIVAISGGPDSVVLADALRTLPYKTVWVHVDHRLRRSSATDARFVQKLAASWDIPVQIVSVDVRGHAKKYGMGIEEAARTLRYRALEKIAHRKRSRIVITAHHADDQAETVLMNVLRGAGHSGLAGIPVARALSAKSPVQLVRPLLKVSRATLMTYVRERQLSYRTDPSNRGTTFTRNRLRHETLPYLTRLFAGLPERLAQMAEIFRAEEDYWRVWEEKELSAWTRKSRENVTVDLTHFLGYHKALARRILRRLLPGFSFQDIERVFTLAQSSRGTDQLRLAENCFVKRTAEKLVIHYRGHYEQS